MEPITTESSAQTKLKILQTSTFSEINDTEVLYVPGTSNPFPSMEKAALQDFISRVGQKAKWITSVCTGSMFLGASGLLKGYKATTHWSLLNTLENFGAIPVEERVVIDRNRVSGAGVTSGIDFGLTLLSMLKNETAAQIAQLMMEYDPAPPFNAGSPRDAFFVFVELHLGIDGHDVFDEIEVAERNAGFERVGGDAEVGAEHIVHMKLQHAL